MKKVLFILIAVLAAISVSAQSVQEHETHIKNQEELMENKKDSIKELDSQIKELKQRVDSLNKEEKKVKIESIPEVSACDEYSLCRRKVRSRCMQEYVSSRQVAVS